MEHQTPTSAPVASQCVGASHAGDDQGFLASDEATYQNPVHDYTQQFATSSSLQAGQEVSWTEWQTRMTPEGVPYYYNLLTQDTCWELPVGQGHPGQSYCGAGSAGGQTPTDDMYMRQTQEVLRQQHEQWAQYYMQYWNWFQQQQQHETLGHAVGLTALPPPPLNASVTDQVAYAMKSYILQQMEEMLSQGAPVAQRKKVMRNWQVQWHPDKNPAQLEVAKMVFQFLGEKKLWFLRGSEETGACDLQLDVDSVD
mmetsp:Transcript_94342/g.163758  ORF Transcript_94342/g.163758 Transcript_94342/m.163758 type:complete len:254 (+) Transcript_94342:3-764(+)